jgi:hypothetical protein
LLPRNPSLVTLLIGKNDRRNQHWLRTQQSPRKTESRQRKQFRPWPIQGSKIQRQSTTQEAFADVLPFYHLAPGASAIKHMQALFVEEGYHCSQQQARYLTHPSPKPNASFVQRFLERTTEKCKEKHDMRNANSRFHDNGEARKQNRNHQTWRVSW